MVTLSKVVKPPLCHYHCSQLLLHPGKSCLHFQIESLLGQSKSIGIFFIPIILVPLVLNLKKLNKQKIKASLKYYVQCVLCCNLNVLIIYNMICLLRALRGRFSYFATGCWPALLSGFQITWFLPEKVLHTANFSLGQLSFEIFLRKSPNTLIRTILQSKHLQMLIFMLNSCVILQTKFLKQHKGFWFIEPLQGFDVKTSSSRNTKDFLLKYVKSLKGHLAIGLFLDLYSFLNRKILIPKNSSLGMSLLIKLKNFKPRMTSFFLSYLTIYKLSFLVLRNYCQKTSTSDLHMLSGFLGGFSYLFTNKISFLNFSILTSIQILWFNLCNYKTKDYPKLNKFLEFLNTLPMKALMFPLISSYYTHHCLFHSDKISPLAVKVFKAMTNNTISKELAFMEQKTNEELSSIANSFTPKGYFK